jgi:GDP-mannose 6-dehydrogenase
VGVSVVRLAIFGLGYVGVVSAACLARDGHRVSGVDPNSTKTELVNKGRSPIVEPGLADLIRAATESDRLKAGNDVQSAVDASDLLLVCVGTPGHENGSLDLGYVRRVCEQIGAALRSSSEYKVVVIRSTMLPGSMATVVIPALEANSGKRAGHEFGVCINPEFLREGCAIYDYDNPPKTVIGAMDDRSAAPLKELYGHLAAPMLVTDLQTAELAKYADNSWHALKITFANEMGRLCKAVGVDSRKLMQLFCEDRKLNISSAYLRPGFAFGGSCLPKDVRALTHYSRSRDVNTPVLSAILPSNRVQIDHALSLIYASGKRRIGLLGLSFKEGTDDLRESPIVTIAERLIGKGYELSIFDRNVKLANLIGANRDYILNHIPHISRLLAEDPATLFERSELIVMATGEKYFGDLVRSHGRGKPVVDLVGAWTNAAEPEALRGGNYEGIAW